MSNIDNLIELNKIINKEDTLQKDMIEATNLIKSMFQKKYIKKLSEELEICKQDHKKRPTKEIQLLQAIKPFINQNYHQQIDSITDTLINFTTLIDIQKNFNNKLETHQKEKTNKKQIKAMSTVVTKNDDVSIKKDGIYDIDENCLFYNQKNIKIQNNNKTNILYILLLFAMLK